MVRVDFLSLRDQLSFFIKEPTMCGIIGIIGPDRASYDVVRGLITLQHRGQDAAGILSYDPQTLKFSMLKKKGLVSEVFHDENSLEDHTGSYAIGHTRYSTVGTGHESELQPLATSYPLGLGLVHNGNVVNYFELVERLRQDHLCHMLTPNDLEVIQAILGQGLRQCLEQANTVKKSTYTYQDAFRPDSLKMAVEKVFQEVHGGYSVIGILAGVGLFAFRDPNGIRPLVLGKRLGPKGEPWYCLSSETGALAALDYEYQRNIRPGEMVLIGLHGEVQSFQITRQEHRPCMFEWVYFAGTEGSLEDRDVYSTRVKLGKFLAKKILLDSTIKESWPDMVVPVPETGRVAALSLAEELGIPYREVLLKNRYIHRSFILNSQIKREKAVGSKLVPIRKEIAGKRILLVDDSIVRGTTSKRIVQLLQDCGAREVTYVSTCPPIRYPCFYGIDFPDRDELIAHGRNEAQVALSIGAQRVIYLDLPDLVSSLNLPEGKPCMACLTGKYPVGVKSAESFKHYRKKQRTQIQELQIQNRD